METLPLALPALEIAYRENQLKPTELVAALCEKMDSRGRDPVWIHRLPRETLLARAAELEAKGRDAAHSLWGVPFAIKDNLDLAEVPTTAACPEFSYTPTESAHVVQRLLKAGAIAVGKANLDQFATGLVGTRSPYGVPVNPFNAAYIPGGSSSGSAVAVSAGLCSFSLGTDTAGSGRVPAAFNHLVGLKPTRGLLSTRGLIPACRTLDCLSIFARTVADTAEVFHAAIDYDERDPFSRRAQPPTAPTPWPPRIGVPREDQREFFGNADAARLFSAAISRWQQLGSSIVEIDYAPFLAAARLLYEGPWVAERYAAIRTFIEKTPEALHPVTRQIIERARDAKTVDAFAAMYRLAELRREAERVWTEIDAMMTPTAGTIYSVAEVEAEPLKLNTNLGHYTNYLNLLDACALAVPAGWLPRGLPWGVTLVAPAFHDDRVLAYGASFLGEKPPREVLRSQRATPASVRVAVCGAHLSGLPLNAQLTQRGGRLVRATHTAPHYRMFALAGTIPAKPGLVRVGEGGSAIEVEVWEIPENTYGSFVAAIPSPLGIGTLILSDGETVQGFLCEACAVKDAREITSFGGWRAFLLEKTGS